jgi:aminoglycoside 6'-N-acetyltransferase I
MTLVVRVLEDGDQDLLERVAPERDPRHHIVGAIADDRVVGFVSVVDYCHPDKPRELWINEVGVAPAWRRRASGRGSCA